MSINSPIVREGEVSESNDEDNSFQLSQKEMNQQAGVVVAGEASESSSDEDEVNVCNDQPLNATANEPQKMEEIKSNSLPVIPEPMQRQQRQEQRHNTLLHKKLREKNIQLRNHIQHLLSDIYTSSARDVTNIAVHAGKSQSGVREVSTTMRLVSNDLFQLEDKVDIVATCSILPDIQLPIVELPTTPS